MNSIDFESLLVIVFVLVDDWYKLEKKPVKRNVPGAKAEMSDSEIMTLGLMMDYLPFPGETQFIGFIRANYGKWFPNLLERSQFNRRLRKLGDEIETLRRMWVRQLGGGDANSFVIDTKPIPVVGYRRSKKHSDFHGSADYGYCAARKMKYFGYKLVVISTLQGLPIAYDLVSANTDERQAVEGVLQVIHGSDIYGDKGFIGQDWQSEVTISTGNRIWTIQRENQLTQVSSDLKRLISRVRQRIEGVFHEIQNTGRNPERLLNKTVGGLTTHMAIKMTSHTLRLFLRHRFGIDVLTFQSLSTY
ncbi:MAG: IS982 family transposase [Hydrococcus sp. SU_1_0]|nr:IS982 family transposase [Hydrococcus sp. SU_1_0]NJO99137.1 IS982 family transposase [Pleurocapsa sp. CRU_1_2]